MASITTRSGKGSPLTNDEVDQNFVSLNTSKLETISGESIKALADVDGYMVPTDGQALIYSAARGWHSGDAYVAPSPTETLAVILTVDGAGSGLDADLLDGQDGSYYTGYTDAVVSAAEQTLQNALVLKADTASLGTAATLDVGTAAGNVVQLDANGKLPPVDGSQLSGVSGFSVATALAYGL